MKRQKKYFFIIIFVSVVLLMVTLIGKYGDRKFYGDTELLASRPGEYETILSSRIKKNIMTYVVYKNSSGRLFYNFSYLDGGIEWYHAVLYRIRIDKDVSLKNIIESKLGNSRSFGDSLARISERYNFIYSTKKSKVASRITIGINNDSLKVLVKNDSIAVYSIILDKASISINEDEEIYLSYDKKKIFLSMEIAFVKKGNYVFIAFLEGTLGQILPEQLAFRLFDSPIPLLDEK